MSEGALIPPRFLFRFGLEIGPSDPLWSDQGTVLDESYRLPPLQELDDQQPFAVLPDTLSDESVCRKTRSRSRGDGDCVAQFTFFVTTVGRVSGSPPEAIGSRLP